MAIEAILGFWTLVNIIIGFGPSTFSDFSCVESLFCWWNAPCYPCLVCSHLVFCGSLAHTEWDQQPPNTNSSSFGGCLPACFRLIPEDPYPFTILHQSVACSHRTAPARSRSLMGRQSMRGPFWWPDAPTTLGRGGSVSKPCTPGEHQNSW